MIDTKNRKIVITTMPISMDKERAFAMSKDSRELINAICDYSRELRKADVEVFGRKDNIIATEKGYFCAFYEQDVIIANNQSPMVEPTVGADGKLKVELERKDTGEKVMQDLDVLVAKTFVPNPNNYQYVRHLDGDLLNCHADNLQWVATEEEI